MAAAKTRLVPIPQTAELDEQALLSAMRVERDHPLYAAVMQILDRNVQAVTSQCGLPDVAANHGALAHCAGGMEWLRYVQAELENYRQRAQKASLLGGKGEADEPG